MALIPEGPYAAGFDPERAYQLCLEKHDGQCRQAWFADEGPVRPLTIHAFWLDRFEVNQADYQRVMGDNPSSVRGEALPVHRVTWQEARDYCRRVGKRLPTEAEWEKAARGGRETVYPWGDRMRSGAANMCDRNCSKKWRESDIDDGHEHVAPPGSYPPNDFGLYDMAGNVYEWVHDAYNEDYYRHRPARNPPGPDGGRHRVMRGGSWINYSVGVRPADRTDADPEDRFDFTGFRCARSADAAPPEREERGGAIKSLPPE